jgi:ATP-dependent Clp protease ATP-binding subunit ClpC
MIDNFFSRLIGMIVRLLVIIFGLIAMLAFFILSLVLALVWIIFPIVFIFFLTQFASGGLPWLIAVIISLIFLLCIFLFYRIESRIPFSAMSLQEMAEDYFFERICGRLGISREDFKKDFLKNQESLDAFLESLNLVQADFDEIINQEVRLREKEEIKKKFWLEENLDLISPIGKHWQYAYTVKLDRYSVDLTQWDPTAHKNIELVGRNEELEVIKLVLERPDQNSVLVTGNAGSGRATIIHHLAKLIRERKIETFLERKRIVLFDLAGAISDSVNNGHNVDSSLHYIFQEAAYAGNIILVIENLENYLGKGENILHPDISAVLGDYLPLPTFQIVATSTSKEYHNLIEKHENVMKYFEVVEIREPNEKETLEILVNNLKRLERKRVIFPQKTLKAIITDSTRYSWHFPLPKRALDLVSEIIIFWEKHPDQFITQEKVEEFLSLKTGVPMGEIKAKEKEKLLNLEEFLHKRVVSQDEAIKQIAQAMRRSRSGVSDSKRPVGSFLFLGPTGVGKTETAKALAEIYFGSEENMIRLDMSEFQNVSSVDRLIGSSQLNQQGRLTNLAKDHPFSLLLLDELEKAYPPLLDLFLQILDEGFITDAFGEKINFRNMIIIATSNAGAPLIKQFVEAGEEPEKIKTRLLDHVIEKNVFRVEFLNRFDGVIFFRPLKDNEVRSVTNLILQKFSRRLSKEKNIEISFNEEAVEKIISAGYNQLFGARSINRYVEDKVEDLVAKAIISGEVKKGEKIKISL